MNKLIIALMATVFAGSVMAADAAKKMDAPKTDATTTTTTTTTEKPAAAPKKAHHKKHKKAAPKADAAAPAEPAAK